MRLPRLLAPPRAAPPPEPPAVPAPLLDPRSLERLTPLLMPDAERIAMATRCRDADPVPKVPGAGGISAAPDGRRVQLMHNGLRVLADGYYGPMLTEIIAQCRGHHEPQEERVFHEVVSRLPSGGTMIELGGYWAYYAAWFLAAAPGRRAVIAEPDPAHAAVGRANLALNGLSAEFVSGFVGDAPGTVRPFATEQSGTLDLPCLDVASLMAAHGMERLTLLHLDVQGAELAALEQAAPLLRDRRVDWVFASTHHHAISGDPLTHQRCLAVLRALGAAIEAEHDVAESFSGDGLICARFGAAPPGWRAPAISRNRYSESLFRNPLHDLTAAAAPAPP